ncbi:hypothetical protein CRE_13455 [Caenorhabditis remanei]|uniref:Uncharacterized protein n=1 Tax=Caenorhabditis remanei TaxID=31234 RepID=E3MR25_CAERE|nr:hypothetical protein CRE_13455 [Caenorhabditis remanei]
MFSFNINGKEDENPSINLIHSSYSREKMLTLNGSPICFLRPALFYNVVRDLPELLRLAPSPDDRLVSLLTTQQSE